MQNQDLNSSPAFEDPLLLAEQQSMRLQLKLEETNKQQSIIQAEN